ncbi:MAG: T9SS type A sorting domain-containing protein [Candidatus Zixiibacteriota bacterium]|nr:MAG: T9SS type A sorting domain-containing protein [candidate division Zixibacteria bacterium]
MKTHIAMILIGSALLAGFAVSPAYSQQPEMGPMRPDRPVDLPPGRGFIPPPMDLSYLEGAELPARLKPAVPPTIWDWREQGKITSIKNQGGCGSCYSFASLANIEAKILIDNLGTFDFSENNAKECNWYDRSCNGGSYYDLASLFSQKGIVLEACDPYVANNVSCNTTCVPSKTLLDWRIICADNVPAASVLKDYIFTCGPVYTTYYAGNGDAWETEMNNYDGSYTMYYAGAEEPNHAVLIVGWDDNLVHAGGTGGWIVKNSWGTSWGGTCGYGSEGGYFTMAYGSASIGMWSSFAADWQDHDQNATIFYYDEAGWTCNYGWSSPTGWGLCKFVPAEDFDLTRVEFWTNDVTSDIDVYIYDDFDGTTLSNKLTEKLDKSYAEAGYHSVGLDSVLAIGAGNDFYAVVKFTNASQSYPFAADNLGPIEIGKTYISLSGASGTWIDVGSSASVDLGIRVRSGTALSLSVDEDEELLPSGFCLTQNHPNPFNPATTIDYSIPRRTHVEISVYNLLGQQINTLVDAIKPPGEHSIIWNGQDVAGNRIPSGVYFYRIRTSDFVQSKKMVLLK